MALATVQLPGFANFETESCVLKQKFDWILNVFFPLSAGTAVYLTPTTVWVSAQVRHYLPDALWAYALTSTILLIWNRQIIVRWILCCFLLAAAIEWGQYIGVIAGTADPLDLLAYYLSILAARVMNPFFQARLQPAGNSKNQKPTSE